jgi:hypothetical protein
VSVLTTASSFQVLIDEIESLSLDEQEMLIEIIHQHLMQKRRDELAKDIAEAREDYQKGNVLRGTVADIMKELNK